MTANMYIISIEENVLVGKLSGNEREHSLLQKYSKECKHSLIMHGIRHIPSFFYLNYQFAPQNFLSTLSDMMKPWPVQLRCLMKRSEKCN